MAEDRFCYPHDTDPDLFREALAYSEAVTGFSRSLIERDYYCSIILQQLFTSSTPLVFKGGTCLGKVYMGFYRLSEDLDYMIPESLEITRGQRRTEIAPVKDVFNKTPETIPGVKILDELTGHDNSRHYIGHFSYFSAIIDKVESIKVEIGLHEPLLSPSELRTVHTIVVNPFNKNLLIPDFSVGVMGLTEMYAEKLRAAMSRREPAVRDFFDISFAIQGKLLNIHDSGLIDMVKRKLTVTGNEPVNLSPSRKDELDRQMESQLRPVLRTTDFSRFDLDEAFEMVRGVARSISE